MRRERVECSIEQAELSRRSVAAVVLLREDGAALFQHRDNKPGLSHAGMWTPPGGHCSRGESMLDCGRRELLEETGYDCDELKPLCSFMDDNVEGVPAYPLVVYWARYDGVQSVRCLEGQGLKFIMREHAELYPIPPYLVEIWDSAIAALLKDESRREEQVSEL